MKPRLDFQVHDIKDPRVLSIMDYSTWGVAEGKPTIIKITLPGDKNPVVHYFQQGVMNVFNSSNLGVVCDPCELPDLLPLDDGIYQITLEGSPDTYNLTKYYLRTTNLCLELDALYMKSKIECKELSCETLQDLIKPSLLIKTAEAFTRVGDFCKAQEIFDLAVAVVEDQKKC